MAQVRDNGHQRVVELRRMGLEADEVNSATLEPLLPRLIVTEDEDVMITQATQVLFHLLNHFWLRPTEKYPDPESAPVCITFDAIATDERRGIYQAFCHVQSFSVFHFSYWRDTKGHDPVAVDHFVRTAAGAFTAAYIIGFHMRNGNDILVKDGEAVFLRGFQGIFDNNNNVGSIFDNNVGTRLTIPKPMKEAFHSLRVWDEFKLCCLRAFEVTRENHDEIFPMLAGLYSRCGVSRSMMYEHLSGKNSLNSSEKSARRSDAAFRKWLNR